jgi:hypothetical protein
MLRSVNGELRSQILASHPLSIETVSIAGPVRMLVSVDSDATAAGDIGISLEGSQDASEGAAWERVVAQ